MGRERTRREIVDGAGMGQKTNIAYDALGRIKSAAKSDTSGILYSAQFAHDALGNAVSLADGIVAADAELTFRPGDRDRICHIDYNGLSTGTACNVTHDGVGNILEMPTRNGSRSLTYFPSGQLESIYQNAPRPSSSTTRSATSPTSPWTAPASTIARPALRRAHRTQ